jgi:hypothetical protein
VVVEQKRLSEILSVVSLYKALGGGWNRGASQPEIPTPLMP